MLRYHTLILSLLVLAACNKKKISPETPEEKGDAVAVIYNKLADSVYVTLSGSDISTGTAPHIVNLAMKASDSVVLTPSELKEGYKYQYSWRTPDYRAGSWLNTDASGKVQQQFFNYHSKKEDVSVSLSSAYRDEVLIYFDGAGLSSTWKAVDAFDQSGTSVWSGLTDREKNHLFVISRFQTVKHGFTDTANKQASTNLAFAMDFSQQRTWLFVTHPTDSFIISNDLSAMVPLVAANKQELFYVRRSNTSGTDIYVPPYYKLVRQNVEK